MANYARRHSPQAQASIPDAALQLVDLVSCGFERDAALEARECRHAEGAEAGLRIER